MSEDPRRAPWGRPRPGRYAASCRRRTPAFVASTLCCAWLAASAVEDSPEVPAPATTLMSVSVTGNSHRLLGVADSASEGVVTSQQLAQRPLLRAAEVLESVPGMVVTQHSGDGKANQYFLRGFNLDHGTDFATQVLGMPVNMASHAHGQGYMDLNFLLPELVRQVRFSKGSYRAEDGDFATTGSARIDYRRELRSPFVSLELGPHSYRRLLGAASTALGSGWQGLVALELATNNGPWVQPEGLRKHNLLLRLSRGDAQNGLALGLIAYDARWNATEHVPQRAIDSGEIGRYGALLPDDGGSTHRRAMTLEWAHASGDWAQRANAYIVGYGLNLFSAPSGFIEGPQGDQHEQADQRWLWGGQWLATRTLAALSKHELSLGLSWRQDRISRLGLYNTAARQRYSTVREDRVLQNDLGLFAELRSHWIPWLRTTLALRRDEVSADVTPLGGRFNVDNGGRARAHLSSPRGGLVLGPWRGAELYANVGTGFHSNDARGATARTNPRDGSPADPLPPLVAARSRELGLRTTPLPGWTSSLSLWQMRLASELVFIGDEGVTEARGATRRRGLEWSNYWTPGEALVLDADISVSRARFVDPDPDSGGREVPNSIPRVAALGLAYDDHGRFFGGLRLRYLGAYPLEPSGTERSTPFWVANLKLGWRVGSGVELSADVLNLYNRRANDIEYWGGACTRVDGAACNNGRGIDGRLVHPLEPRALRLALRISL